MISRSLPNDSILGSIKIVLHKSKAIELKDYSGQEGILVFLSTIAKTGLR